MREKLTFTKEIISANFMDPSGESAQRLIESRKHPITFRTCRITLSRSQEKEAGTESMPVPPPNAADTFNCPFCAPQLYEMTPCLDSKIFSARRLKMGKSILFPNLFPYGSYYQQNRSLLFSDYLAHERKDGNRYIGTTGDWEWMAAFAPETTCSADGESVRTFEEL